MATLTTGNLMGFIEKAVNEVLPGSTVSDKAKQGLVGELTAAYAETLKLMDSPPLSLYLAQNPHRFKGSPAFVRSYGKSAVEADKFELQVKLQNATKFLMPAIGYSVSATWTRSMDDEGWNKFETSSAFQQNKEFIQKYLSFFRMPVEDMVFENSTGAYLLSMDTRWPGAIVYRVIYQTTTSATMTPTIYVIYPTLDEDGYLKVEMFESLSGKTSPLILNQDTAEGIRYRNVYVRQARMMASEIFELLVILNTANVTVHHYIPTKTELKRVPSVLHGNYNYFVLDMSRLRQGFNSILEVSRFTNGGTPEELIIQNEMLGNLKFRQCGDQLFMWCRAYRKKPTHNQQQPE